MYLRLGKYADHLEELYKHFPKDQVHVFRYEEFKNDTAGLCNKIVGLIGLDEYEVDLETKFNTTKEQRSATAAKMIHKLKQNRNPIKRLAKAILPYKVFYKLSRKLLNANKKPAAYVPISDKASAALSDYFKSYNKRLEEMTGFDLSNWK